MIIWRLARKVYAALNGQGPRLYGGRWNSIGTPVVYTSEHLSLAALEFLVHFTDHDLTPLDLTAFKIEAPENSIEVIYQTDLPDGWTEHPVCARLGDIWAERNESLLLRVPSAVIPIESNLLINPNHRRFKEVRLVDSFPFAFDRRLAR